MASFSNIDELLEKYEYFVFDCDGVLWQIGATEIPGSMDVLKKIEAMGKRHFFITNHGAKSSELVASQLKQFGIETDPSNCPVTSEAAAAFIKSKNLHNKKVLVLGEQ